MALNTMSDTFRMAERLTIPQLVHALKTGTIEPSVGQLVLNNKIQQQKRMEQSQQAQVPPQPPVAAGNMAAAEQQMGGVPGFAGGGRVPIGDEEREPMFPFNMLEAARRRMMNFNSEDAKKVGIGFLQDPTAPVRNAAGYTVGKASDKLKDIVSGGPGAFYEDHTGGMGAPPQAPLYTPPPQQMEPPQSGRGGGGGIASIGVPRTNLTEYDTSGLVDPSARIAEMSARRSAELGAGDKEVFDAIKGDLAKQRDQIKSVDKQNLYLSLIKGGLAAAAGKSQYGLTNIAEGAQQGVNQYIQRDVLNREMENRLGQREQMLKLEEMAQRKGNMSLADKYGMDAARLGQEAQQLKGQLTHFENQNKLGLAGLNLEAQRANQQAAYQSQALNMRAGYNQAMTTRAQAQIMKIRSDAAKDFMQGPGRVLDMQLQQQYGKDWRDRSVAAQATFARSMQDYMGTALGNDPMMSGMQGGYQDADQLLMDQ